ncbi:MAG: fatty acid desaturase [Nannocystaceae bacterium]|nr:fatty acid desaturase [Nannocystaceae bacterium]
MGPRPSALDARAVPPSGDAGATTDTPLEGVDLDAFTRELEAIVAEARADTGEADLHHLRKIERIGRIAGLIGLATAFIAPNPLSVFALSFARFVRWTGVAHPVVHKGYEGLEGTPHARTSGGFAKGWRRVIDWFDWIDPAAWQEEHNIQHHYRLNEEADPDLVERNLSWLRESAMPKWLRRALVPFMAMSWKFVYYAPSTLEALARAEARRGSKEPATAPDPLRTRWSKAGKWSFLPSVNRRLWLRSWGPYFLGMFVVLPLLFTPLGAWAVASVLINSLLAEALTNVHSFLAIVPNHAGEDLYRFEGRTRGRGEFYLRQILGSTNYPCGRDSIDIFYGWLNYQIEHHLWPDLSLLQYRKIQPKVREVCERYGVPYVQEPMWTRVRKTVDVMVGDASMPVLDTGALVRARG